MRQGRGLQRRKPLRQVGRKDRAATNAAAEDDAAKAFSAAVKARAGGWCEVCPRLMWAETVLPLDLDEDPDERAARIRRAVDVARGCSGVGAHAHHVVGRGSGGHGDHRTENGLWTCWRAHTFIHDRDRDLAERLGVIGRRNR